MHIFLFNDFKLSHNSAKKDQKLDYIEEKPITKLLISKGIRIARTHLLLR
jgi:hypothetical protein